MYFYPHILHFLIVEYKFKSRYNLFYKYSLKEGLSMKTKLSKLSLFPLADIPSVPHSAWLHWKQTAAPSVNLKYLSS